MLTKIAVVACILALAKAGHLGNSVSYHQSYPAPVHSYAAPTLSATSNNVYRSHGNLHTISSHTKSIATPYSSSNKHDVRITNPGVYTHAAPVVHAAYSAPLVHHAAYAAPVAHHALHSAPVAHHVAYAAATPVAHHADAYAAPVAHHAAYAAPLTHTAIAHQHRAEHAVISAPVVHAAYAAPVAHHTGYAHAAPIASHHIAAPIVHEAPIAHISHAAPISHNVHAAPIIHDARLAHSYAAPIAHAAVATNYATGHGHSGHGSLHHSRQLGLAYSPAAAVSHLTYNSPIGVNYSW